MEYALEDAYVFSDQRATAFKFNHPKKSLVWWNGKVRDDDSCEVYDIKNQRPMFLSNHAPVLATWSGFEGGLNLYFLDQKKSTRLLPELPLSHVDSRYLWLSEKSDKLFFSPETLSAGDTRQLLQISLKKD
jgi:hypothetical protein